MTIVAMSTTGKRVSAQPTICRMSGVLIMPSETVVLKMIADEMAMSPKRVVAININPIFMFYSIRCMRKEGD